MLSPGETITEPDARPAPPRDFTLEAVTNKARATYATMDLHTVNITIKDATAELEKITNELEGVGQTQGLRVKYWNKVDAARRSGPRGTAEPPPAPPARLVRLERRLLDLEGALVALRERKEELSAKEAAEFAEREADEEEARLFAQFQAEERAAAAAAERKRFTAWLEAKGFI